MSRTNRVTFNSDPNFSLSRARLMVLLAIIVAKNSDENFREYEQLPLSIFDQDGSLLLELPYKPYHWPQEVGSEMSRQEKMVHSFQISEQQLDCELKLKMEIMRGYKANEDPNYSKKLAEAVLKKIKEVISNKDFDDAVAFAYTQHNTEMEEDEISILEFTEEQDPYLYKYLDLCLDDQAFVEKLRSDLKNKKSISSTEEKRQLFSQTSQLRYEWKPPITSPALIDVEPMAKRHKDFENGSPSATSS